MSVALVYAVAMSQYPTGSLLTILFMRVLEKNSVRGFFSLDVIQTAKGDLSFPQPSLSTVTLYVMSFYNV